MEGFEPIDDDEVLYRRVLEVHFDRTVRATPDPQAMRPIAQDVDGLSLKRARYWTAEQVSRGRPGKTYFVAHLRAGSVRSLLVATRTLTLRPDDPDVPNSEHGHCVIPELVYATRGSDESESFQRLLASTVHEVEGPFRTPA